MPESRRSPDAPGGRPIHAHAAETQPGTGSAFVVDAPSHGDVSAEEEGASAEVVEAAEELVKEAFRNHDPSHDFHHVNRVRLMALHLSQDVHLPSAPDRLTVELAALFHDMVDKKYLPSFLSKPESGSSGSADVDAAAAATGPIPAQIVLGPFLKEHAAVVGSQRSETICRIADHVSWSKDQARRAARRRAEKAGEPLSALDLATWEWERSCIEYQLVSDADRLDAIGSFGIMRCAAFAAVKNNPLHVPPKNAQVTSAPPHEQSEGYSSSAIAHFYSKLVKIRGDNLWTETGRKEADRRQNVMSSFLTELDLEWMVAEQGLLYSQTGSW